MHVFFIPILREFVVLGDIRALPRHDFLDDATLFLDEHLASWFRLCQLIIRKHALKIRQTID